MSEKENHKQKKLDTRGIRNIKTKSKNSEFPHNSPYLNSKRKAEKPEFSIIHGKSENEFSSLDDQTLSPYPELLKSPVLSPEVQQMLKDLGVTLNPVEESHLSYLSTNKKLTPFQNISKKIQDTTDSASTLKSLNLHSFIESSTPNYSTDKNSSQQQNFEREKFRRQHCEKVIEDLQHKLLEQDQNIAVLEAESDKKDEALQELQVTFQKVCEAWENVALPNVEKLKELTSERDNLINQLQSVKQIVENLKTELDTKENELKNSLIKEDELKTEVKSLKNQNQELSEQLQQEKSQSMKFEEKVKDMNSEIQSLQTHLTKEQEETLFRESEMDKKLVELKQMKVRNQQLITELQNKLITVQELYHNAEQKNILLANEKMYLEQQLTESEAKRLSQEASSLATLEHKINELDTEANRRHEDQVRELQIQHKKEKDSLVQLHEEKIQLAYQSHQKEIDELKRKLNQKIIDKNNEFTVVSEEVQRLRHNLERLATSRSQILSRLQTLLQFHWLEALDLLYGSSSTISEKEAKNSWTELDITSNNEIETKKDINSSNLWSNDVSQNLVKTLFKTNENLNDSHHLNEKLHGKYHSESNDKLSYPYKSDIDGLRDLYWYSVTEDIRPIQNSVSTTNSVTHPNRKHQNVVDNVQTVFSSNKDTCHFTGFDMSKGQNLLVPQKYEETLEQGTIPNELLDIRKDFLGTMLVHELADAKKYVESANYEEINRGCTEELDETNHRFEKLNISAVKLNPFTSVSCENQTCMAPRNSEQPLCYNLCSMNQSPFPNTDFNKDFQLLNAQAVQPAVSENSSDFQPVSSDYSSIVHSLTSNNNNNTSIRSVSYNHNATVQPVTSNHNATVHLMNCNHNPTVQSVTSNHSTAFHLVNCNHGTAFHPVNCNHGTAFHPVNCNHSTAFCPVNCNHSTAFRPVNCNHSTAFRPVNCNHSTAFRPVNCNHSTAFRPVNSNHSTAFRPVNSNHSTAFQPINCNNNATVQPVTCNCNITNQPVTTIIHSTTAEPVTSYHSSIFQPELSNLSNKNHSLTSSSSFLNNIALPVTSNQTLYFDVQPVLSHVSKPVELKPDLRKLTQLLLLNRDLDNKQKSYTNNTTEPFESRFLNFSYSTASNSCHSNTLNVLSPHLNSNNSVYLVTSDSDHNVDFSLASNSVFTSSVQSADSKSNFTNTVCSVTSSSSLTNSGHSVTSRPDFTNSIQLTASNPNITNTVYSVSSGQALNLIDSSQPMTIQPDITNSIHSANSCLVSNDTSSSNVFCPSNLIDSDIKDDFTGKTTETFDDWLSSKEYFKSTSETQSEYSTSTSSQQARETILNHYVLKVLQQTPKSHQSRH
ncbi:uncharacterized protein LOC143256892 isoform X2 [Tachypleus tridentatus]